MVLFLTDNRGLEEGKALHWIMTAISRPQLQAVNGSRCGDQRVSQFDAVAFRKHPQVVAGTPPDLQVDRNALDDREEIFQNLVLLRPCRMPKLCHRDGRTHEHGLAPGETIPFGEKSSISASRNLDQNVGVNQNRRHNAILDSRLPLRSWRTYFPVSGKSLRSRQMPTRACIALLRLAGELP